MPGLSDLIRYEPNKADASRQKDTASVFRLRNTASQVIDEAERQRQNLFGQVEQHVTKMADFAGTLATQAQQRVSSLNEEVVRHSIGVADDFLKSQPPPQQDPIEAPAPVEPVQSLDTPPAPTPDTGASQYEEQGNQAPDTTASMRQTVAQFGPEPAPSFNLPEPGPEVAQRPLPGPPDQPTGPRVSPFTQAGEGLLEAANNAPQLPQVKPLTGAVRGVGNTLLNMGGSANEAQASYDQGDIPGAVGNTLAGVGAGLGVVGSAFHGAAKEAGVPDEVANPIGLAGDLLLPQKGIEEGLHLAGRGIKAAAPPIGRAIGRGVEAAGRAVDEAGGLVPLLERGEAKVDLGLGATLPRYISKEEMLQRGADGHLSRAVEVDIPVSKIDGREPSPSMDDMGTVTPDRGYVKGRPITQPVEAQYDEVTDTYLLYAGNHRVTQAEVNGDTHIPAFVEGINLRQARQLREEAARSRGIAAGPTRQGNAQKNVPTKRFYHGTGSTFGKVDGSKFDPNALSGLEGGQANVGTALRVGADTLGGTTGGYAGYNADPDASPEDRLRNTALGAAAGVAAAEGGRFAPSAARAIRGGVRQGVEEAGGLVPYLERGSAKVDPTAPARETADDALLAVRKMLQEGKPAREPLTRLEQAVVGKGTKLASLWDAGAPVRRVQDVVYGGRPLSVEEDAALQLRNYAGRAAAAVAHVDDELMPAIKALDPAQRQGLDELLVLADNSDKAASIGRRVEGEVLSDPLGRVAGERALPGAETSVRMRRQSLDALQQKAEQARVAAETSDRDWTLAQAKLDPPIEAWEGSRSGYTYGQYQEAREGLDAITTTKDALAAARDAHAATVAETTKQANDWRTLLQKNRKTEGFYRSDIAKETRSQIADATAKRDAATKALAVAEAEYRAAQKASVGQGWRRIAETFDPAVETDIQTQIDALRAQHAQAKAAWQAADAEAKGAEQAAAKGERMVASGEARTQRLKDVVETNRATAESKQLERGALKGAEAEENRLFSGGVHAHSMEENLAALERTYGPEVAGKIQQSADQVWKFSQSLRDRAYKAGLLTQDVYDAWTRDFPHYAKADILKYFDDAERSTSVGAQTGKPILTVGDISTPRLTVEGTKEARDKPLNSLVKQAFAIESLARRNEMAQAILKMRDASPELQRLLKPVAENAEHKLAANERYFSVYVDGVQKRFVGPKELEGFYRIDPAEIPQWARVAANIMGAPLLRAGATGVNTAFILPNALRDANQFMLRTGGFSDVKQVGKSAAALGRAYVDSAKIMGGKKVPDWQEALKAGAGQFSEYSGLSPEQLQRRLLKEGKLGGLVRPLETKADLAGVIGDWLKVPFEPVRAVGEAIERAPRLAAYRLAKEGGAPVERASLAARDITMDFQRAGNMAKVANTFIPFFNATMQGGERFLTLDLAKGNRLKTGIGITTSVIIPTLASEAYNRVLYPEDYADVPDYLKDTGFILMSPLDPPANPDGSRGQRGYAWIPRPQSVNFLSSVITKLTEQAVGDDTRQWSDVLRSVIGDISPVNTESLPLPPIPKTAFELAANKDLFRNQEIVPENLWSLPQKDQARPTTSALGRGVGAAINKPPAAVDYAITSTAGGVGRQALHGLDVIARIFGLPAAEPARTAPVLDVPVVGDTVGSIIRNRGGQTLTDQLAKLDREFAKERDAIAKEMEADPGWNTLTPAEKQQEKLKETDALSRDYQQMKKDAREDYAGGYR